MSEIEKYDEAAPALPSPREMSLQQWAMEARAANALAQSLVQTPFAGSWKGDAGGATAAILKGSELGLTPVTALAAFDNIQGTPAPKAITLRALVQGHGHDLEIIEETETKATARYRRKGGDWQETSFTIEEAKQMNLLGKDNWKKQPRNMLVARVTSKAARLVASDVILGIGYSSEELLDHSRQGNTRAEQVWGPEETGEAMTEKTRSHMFALFTRKGVAEADQLSGINHICGTTYESRGDLTEADAQRVIGVLKSRPDVVTEEQAEQEALAAGSESDAAAEAMEANHA